MAGLKLTTIVLLTTTILYAIISNTYARPQPQRRRHRSWASNLDENIIPDTDGRKISLFEDHGTLREHRRIKKNMNEKEVPAVPDNVEIRSSTNETSSNSQEMRSANGSLINSTDNLQLQNGSSSSEINMTMQMNSVATNNSKGNISESENKELSISAPEESLNINSSSTSSLKGKAAISKNNDNSTKEDETDERNSDTSSTTSTSAPVSTSTEPRKRNGKGRNHRNQHRARGISPDQNSTSQNTTLQNSNDTGTLIKNTTETAKNAEMSQMSEDMDSSKNISQSSALSDSNKNSSFEGTNAEMENNMLRASNLSTEVSINSSSTNIHAEISNRQARVDKSLKAFGISDLPKSSDTSEDKSARSSDNAETQSSDINGDVFKANAENMNISVSNNGSRFGGDGVSDEGESSQALEDDEYNVTFVNPEFDEIGGARSDLQTTQLKGRSKEFGELSELCIVPCSPVKYKIKGGGGIKGEGAFPPILTSGYVGNPFVSIPLSNPQIASALGAGISNGIYAGIQPSREVNYELLTAIMSGYMGYPQHISGGGGFGGLGGLGGGYGGSGIGSGLIGGPLPLRIPPLPVPPLPSLSKLLEPTYIDFTYSSPTKIKHEGVIYKGLGGLPRLPPAPLIPPFAQYPGIHGGVIKSQPYIVEHKPQAFGGVHIDTYQDTFLSHHP